MINRDDELTTVQTEVTSAGIPITPPSCPVERARWEAGVAARKASGRGTQVGDY